MKLDLSHNLSGFWYRKSWSLLAIILLPFAGLFGLCAGMRRLFYRLGLCKVHYFICPHTRSDAGSGSGSRPRPGPGPASDISADASSDPGSDASTDASFDASPDASSYIAPDTSSLTIPVIVVGNISVGGTGKTPFVIWLVKFLQAQGYRPGIVSRGVGRKKWLAKNHIDRVHMVKPDDEASEVGDEALLLVRNTNCALVIGVDRVAAVKHLIKHSNCNIVISDDGLQHYRLGRELEIAMLDGSRRCGNKLLLPAGPLREPVSRLQTVDFVVVNGGNDNDAYRMTLQANEFISVMDEQDKISFAEFQRSQVHAVAAIGNPQRFFSSLVNAGFDVLPHVFPDHHLYQPQDLNFQNSKTSDSLPILMTEKDAVKCSSFADKRYWYLSVRARMNAEFEQALLTKLDKLKSKLKLKINSLQNGDQNG
jgi:tetraacyldisaccharide 4'-kinase